jgi:hypothetical protein
MNTEDFKSLEIGDRIEFRSPTRHNTRKAIRKVTGFPKVYDDIESWGHRSTVWVHVRFEGTPGFMVKRHEIIRRIS